MAIEAFYPHRCIIGRRTQSGTDAYNNPTYDWVVVASDQPCRLVERRERIWRDELAEAVVVTVYRLLLPPGVDVAERDRATITLEGGTMVGPYTFRRLLKRRAGRGVHHLSVELEVAA